MRVELTSEISVQLVDAMGDDLSVARAAWVSTKGERAQDEADPARVEGLIGYLMRNRHGTPFEQNSLTFLVRAPIFVFREWHRHRVGWSYNELSGRYSKLEPRFYVPGPDRPLVNAGSSAHPDMAPGDVVQYEAVARLLEENAAEAYLRYEELIEAGVANEVARMVLPVNVYSAMYATCNARSLMHFLALRTDHPEAKFPSKPMWEIAVAAGIMEEHFAERFPITYRAFVENGRVAP